MSYYALAVGDAPSLRYGEGSDEREACEDAYGSLYKPNVMTAIKMPRNPKYMSRKALVAIQDQLVKLHKEKLDGNQADEERTERTNPLSSKEN